MNQTFFDALENSPIIAAAKDEKGLNRCLTCDSRIIFLLFGDILNIGELVEQIKNAGKIAMVHIDLVQGLSSKEIAVDFVKKYTRADGIISTKPALVKHAQKLNLFTVLRFFVIDSLAFASIEKQLASVKPDIIEVLPALMPKVISRICKMVSVPVIAGGLISDKEDILSMLSAGAVSVSSTSEKTWFL